MKKVLLIIVMVINLLPSYHNGRIALSSLLASGQRSVQCSDTRDPGPGFWSFVKNVLGDVADGVEWIGEKISDFFKKKEQEPGGEKFVEEREQKNWEPDEESIDFDFRPAGAPEDIQGSWQEFWNDDEFDKTGLSTEQEEILNNLQDMYTDWYNNTFVNPVDPRYYIQLGYLGRRYYDNDSIITMKTSALATLVLKNEKTPYTVQQTNMSWKQDGVVKATDIYVCRPAQVVGMTQIQVDSADTKTLIHNPFIMYNKPTIVFERKTGWNGEYGFDDSSHKHPEITGVAKYQPGTETTTINGSNYVVPWLGVLDSQTATVKVTKLNLSPLAAQDPAFLVTLRCSNAHIQLNGQPDLSFNYNQLQALTTLDISSTEWDVNSDVSKTVGTIVALTGSGDTIGKLHVSCAKPVMKKVVFVYVNTGFGLHNTNTFTKQNILDYVNNHGHNQMMRQWQLVTQYNYLDTLDCTSEYNADPDGFKDADYIQYKIKQYFHDHKNMFISDFNPGIQTESNDPAKIHVIFVMNYKANGTTTGISDKGKVVTTFFSNAHENTKVHELSHLLNLAHVFPDYQNGVLKALNYNISQGSTCNVMDYGPDGSEYNEFGFFQWVDVDVY